MGQRGTQLSQAVVYPAYLNDAMKAHASLRYCGLSLAEMAHTIEKYSREAYGASHPPGPPTKEYRHNFPAERTRVVQDVEVAWRVVSTMATCLEISVARTDVEDSLLQFVVNSLDGYDVAFVRALRNGGLTGILTDDGDFATVDGLTVFTANRNVIGTAQRAGSLVVR